MATAAVDSPRSDAAKPRGNKLTVLTADAADDSGDDDKNVDAELEQSYPMMPQEDGLPRSVSQQVKMAEELPKPTGMLTWIGFGCCVLALTTLCISFASPYWVETYPMSFNHFRNIGLWEVCFDHYMHHRDQSQQIYSGCWWVFEHAMYNKLKEWLLPPWFIACQVMATMSLLTVLATSIIVAFVFLHFCPFINHEYMQSYGIFIASALMFLSTIITLVVGVVFGLNCGDRNWMPRPDLNLMSWGYGFFIVHGMAAATAGVCFYTEAKRCYYELMDREDEYAMLAADMEVDAYLQQQQAADLSAYPPSYASSSAQHSYGQTSFDKPATAAYAGPGQASFDQSVEKPGYGPQSQSSYGGQPGMEKPGYGQSQSSYGGQPGMEKPGYGQSQSSYGGQPGMEKPGYGQSQSSYGQPEYGQSQSSYGQPEKSAYGYPSQQI